MGALLKFLLLIALGLWLWYSPAVRRLWRPTRHEGDAPAQPGAGSGPRTWRWPGQRNSSVTPEAMVRCAHCGIHLPQGEAEFTADGHAYCGAAHRALGPAHTESNHPGHGTPRG